MAGMTGWQGEVPLRHFCIFSEEEDELPEVRFLYLIFRERKSLKANRSPSRHFPFSDAMGFLRMPEVGNKK